MRAQLLHLSGPLRGRTVTYPERLLRVGSEAGSEVRLVDGEVAPRHAQIEWVEAECQFHLRTVDGEVFVNGNQVEEVILDDGDQVEFGAGGPKVRFRIYVPIGAVCKPVRRMLEDARDVAVHSGGAAGTQTLTRDLFTQATPSLKVGFPLFVVAVAFLVGWIGGWLGSRPSAEERRRTADLVTKAELDELRRQQAAQTAELQRLAQANAVIRRIQKEWSRGVCLVHGVWRLRMASGTWFELRAGEPVEFEYTGSGFLATPHGHIVTNRHVAVPWLEETSVQPLLQAGAMPEFTHLTATFPDREPIAVPPGSILRRPDDLDVAVLVVPEPLVQDMPVLPLRRTPVDNDDQRAIVVGYPTGLASLLARADSEVVEKLRQSAANLTDAIALLAAERLIAPVITQGIVSNVQEHVIAYDALTTGGGSGGPVFGGSGEVIAVNYAIQRGFSGHNFGVPIRFAVELLPE